MIRSIENLDRRIIAFAEGSPKQGFGHLFRLKNLIKTLGKYEFICLTENPYQEKFFDENNIENISLKLFKENFLEIVFPCLIIDSKLDKSLIMESIRAKKKILIDSIPSGKMEFDVVITPSFYSDKKLSYSEKKPSHLFGPGYVILDPRIRELSPACEKESRKLVLSFGGSDPNNITLKCAKILKKAGLADDLLIVLGPGYRHSIHSLERVVPGSQIIIDPQNIYKIFNDAYFVLTALGVTIQELKYLSKPTGIIYNYHDDKKDISKILDYFEGHPETCHYFNFGHHNKIAEGKMVNKIIEIKSNRIYRSHDDNLGNLFKEDIFFKKLK